jgi:hypothetical protein
LQWFSTVILLSIALDWLLLIQEFSDTPITESLLPLQAMLTAALALGCADYYEWVGNLQGGSGHANLVPLLQFPALASELCGASPDFFVSEDDLSSVPPGSLASTLTLLLSLS